MISKQVLLIGSVVLGVGLLSFALTSNNSSERQAQKTDAKITHVAKPVAQPLTADVATEERLLEQKQKARLEHERQMQQQTDILLAEQEKARLSALEKANAERQGRQLVEVGGSEAAAKSELIAAPTIQTRPEAIEAAKKAAEEKRLADEAKQREAEAAKSNKPTESKPAAEKKSEPVKSESAKKATKTSEHKVKSGETWTSIANHYGVSVADLTAANGVGRNDVLRADKVIKVPSSAKATRTDTTKSKQKSAETKDTKKVASGRYTVQVALSSDQAKVDELVKQYRAAGYKVSTSKTTRGIRVLIGGGSEAEAKALRQKITHDSRVKSDGAWIHQVQ